MSDATLRALERELLRSGKTLTQWALEVLGVADVTTAAYRVSSCRHTRTVVPPTIDRGGPTDVFVAWEGCECVHWSPLEQSRALQEPLYDTVRVQSSFWCHTKGHIHASPEAARACDGL